MCLNEAFTITTGISHTCKSHCFSHCYFLSLMQEVWNLWIPVKHLFWPKKRVRADDQKVRRKSTTTWFVAWIPESKEEEQRRTPPIKPGLVIEVVYHTLARKLTNDNISWSQSHRHACKISQPSKTDCLNMQSWRRLNTCLNTVDAISVHEICDKCGQFFPEYRARPVMYRSYIMHRSQWCFSLLSC